MEDFLRQKNKNVIEISSGGSSGMGAVKGATGPLKQKKQLFPTLLSIKYSSESYLQILNLNLPQISPFSIHSFK